jgi:hypothetical protein
MLICKRPLEKKLLYKNPGQGNLPGTLPSERSSRKSRVMKYGCGVFRVDVVADASADSCSVALAA